jgi:hypothetical protein
MPDGSLSVRPRIRSTGWLVRARRRHPDGSREPWGHGSRCLVGSSEGSRRVCILAFRRERVSRTAVAGSYMADVSAYVYATPP